MKKLLLFSILFLTLCQAIQVTNDLQRSNLKGNVKEMWQSKTKTKTEKPKFYYSKYFNKSGYLLNIGIDSTFRYKDNLLIEVNTRDAWSGEPKTAKVTNEPNANGLLRTFIYPRETYYQQFNKKGLLIENYGLYKEIKEPYRLYKYNNKNQCISYTELNGRKDIVEKSTYEYDEKGNKNKEIQYKPYSYNSSKKILTMEYNNFDEHGNWIESTVYKNGKFHYKIYRKFEYYQ